MSDSFAASAAKLFALAAQALGWTPDTFWKATPADLALALGTPDAAHTPITRAELLRMIESDTHG